MESKINPADPVSRPFSFSSAADIISASINVSLTPFVGAGCQIRTVVCTKSGGGGSASRLASFCFTMLDTVRECAAECLCWVRAMLCVSQCPGLNMVGVEGILCFLHQTKLKFSNKRLLKPSRPGTGPIVFVV